MARARPPVIPSVWWPPGLLAVVTLLWLVAVPSRDTRERPAVVAAPAWWFVRSVGAQAGGSDPPVRVDTLPASANAAAKETPGDADEAEVCGYGRVQRAPDDPDL